MARSIYVETSIISYLAMPGSGILRVAANQQTTHEWWNNESAKYDLFVSKFVWDECAAGDPAAAKERSVFLRDIPLLELSEDVTAVADALIEEMALPEKAIIDALHIAAAAVNGVEYLLTWNCRHIANPSLRPKIEGVCEAAGFECPIICTPQELLEIDDVS